MCLIIIPVEYVSVTNAGDAEADDRKESHFYLNDREANKSVLYLRNNKYTKSGFAKPDQNWLIPSINKKDEIMLSSHNWSKPTCMAYHCPACRKVIIDYSVKSE